MYKRASQRSGGSGGDYKGWHDGAGWWIDGKRYAGSRPYYSDRRSEGAEGSGWLVLVTLAAAGYGLYRFGRWLFSSTAISTVNNSSVYQSQPDRAPEVTHTRMASIDGICGLCAYGVGGLGKPANTLAGRAIKPSKLLELPTTSRWADLLRFGGESHGMA
jgi:hypothetical protein